MSVHWTARGAGYAVCQYCRRIVRVNKPILGGLHICLTVCERRHRHAKEKVRRVGPFWARKGELFCPDCNTVFERNKKLGKEVS